MHAAEANRHVFDNMTVMVQALILDSAVDNIEKVMGWKLTRQYSFPKLDFKVTPGVDKPSTVSVRHDTRSGQSSATSQDPSSGPTSSSTATGASGQQPAKPLVTEVTNTTAAKASDQDKAGRSSGFRFPAAKAKPDNVPMRSLLTGTAVPSQPVAGRNIGTSSNDSEQSVMTAVATTRMEAVQLQPGASATAGGDDEGVVQPKFELVYRGQVDLGDAWEGPGVTAAATKYPKVSCIRCLREPNQICICVVMPVHGTAQRAVGSLTPHAGSSYSFLKLK